MGALIGRLVGVRRKIFSRKGAKDTAKAQRKAANEGAKEAAEEGILWTAFLCAFAVPLRLCVKNLSAVSAKETRVYVCLGIVTGVCERTDS